MMNNQMSFQDAASTTMKAIINFHDYTMTTIVFVSIYTAWLIFELLTFNSYSLDSLFEGHQLESVWTTLPSILLITLGFPSLHLLYEIEENELAVLTLKVTGHQWYWSYDYADFVNLEFDSYMLPTNQLSPGEFRLLEVDNRIVLPWNIKTRMLITAADVLHAWTIPSMGVKVDAVPGRLNQLTLTPNIPGIHYGQCSEICGANHSFMPIAMEVISPPTWMEWTKSMSTNNL